MATHTSPTPSAQVVGNAFVEQYYHILHQSPDLVHRFYTDSSVLSRPGPDGNMTSVKTMQAINQAILSLDYKDYKAEINTIDSQDSYKEGVVVLVSGWLTLKDNVKRKFTQSFFLAPQDKGYFVLNDIFRYLDEYNSPESEAVPDVNVNTEKIPPAPVTPDPEPCIPDLPVSENTTPAVEVVYGNGEVVHEPSENGDVPVQANQVPVAEVPAVEEPVQANQVEVRSVPVTSSVPITEQQSSTVQEDTPKKSYASIVKVNKGTRIASPVFVRTTGKVSGSAGKVAVATAKVAAVNGEQHSAVPAPEASAPGSNNVTNGSNLPEEVEGHSIYIRSLPLNASVAQVEEEFKKFGTIVPNGVQVRSNKQGFCFGFVEFVSADSKQSALEASPITIGGRQAHVEEKRTTTRVGPTGRPHFPGRIGFRNFNGGGRGNFNGGGRGYGRNEFGNRSDFPARRAPLGRPSGRSSDGYQRVEHIGNGRVNRQDATNQTATVSV